jgi:hypothetical protein
MDGLDLASLRHQSEGLWCDMHEPRGLTEIEPRFIPIFGWLVHWNAVMRTQRGDALTRPAVAMTRDEAIPVEDAGNVSTAK